MQPLPQARVAVVAAANRLAVAAGVVQVAAAAGRRPEAVGAVVVAGRDRLEEHDRQVVEQGQAGGRRPAALVVVEAAGVAAEVRSAALRRVRAAAVDKHARPRHGLLVKAMRHAANQRAQRRERAILHGKQ